MPTLGVHRSLVQNADGTYSAKDKAQTVWEFDGSGRLIQIRDRFGNASNLTYDTNGRLSTVSDPAGRGVLTFTYTNGVLTTVSDWATPARSITYQYTGGRLWKVTNREGKTTTFGYDGSSSRIATITDARANVALTLTYDAQGRVATQKDARGLTTGDVTTFTYVTNPDGSRVTTTTAPVTSFEPTFHPTVEDTYDPSGWLVTRVTRPSSTETLTQSFTYDSAGNQTSATDQRGNRTDFCYDIDYAGSPISGGEADLTRVIAPPPTPGAARPVTLTRYDANHNVIQSVTSKGVPSGTTVTCSTDLSAINVSFATDSTYDATSVFLLATTTRFTDPDTGPKTAITKLEYLDAANPGAVTRTIPPRGNSGPSPDYSYATTGTYFTTGSRAGMLKDLADPLGNKVSFDYDSVGRLTARVDQLGNVSGAVAADHTTLITYDNEDRVRFKRLPAPNPGGSQLVSETRYDEVGNPVVRIDPNGQVTTYAYDNRDGLFQVKESPNSWTDPVSPPSGVVTTEYAYDAAGYLIRMTRAKGDASNERTTDYAFDGRGLVRVEKQYPLWPSTSGALVTTSTYDPSGNLSTLIDPLARTVSYGYDALERRTSVDYSDPGTPDVAYGYDANGNRTSMTDSTGSSSYGYDEANRPISVTSPGPKTVGYRYDVDGNRTKLIYPDATAVSYVIDKAGQMASLTDWAARAVSYTYWPDGLVHTATNPDGSVTTFEYDNARRATDIKHRRSSGQSIDRFFYTLDAAGNVTSVANGSLGAQFARPDGLASSSGSWTGTYASINESPPNDGTFLASPANPTTDYYEVTLTDVEQPSSLVGITFRYRYAKSGNNSGKTINLTVELRQGSTVISSQTHANIPGASGSGWQQGSVTLTTQQAALITNFADLRLRFRPTSSGGGQSRTAQISWAETQLPGSGDPATAVNYGYDRLYRLTSAADSAGARSYTYDPVGNRLTRVAGSTTSYTYDRADRMTAAGALAVTVDANGNLTARGGDSFAYDQANRLQTATVSGMTETYAYDGDSIRFNRQVGAASPVRYVSDPNRNLPVTIDDGIRKYVWGVDLSYAVSGSTLEIFHADRFGSMRVLTDGSGAVTATYRNDDWGNLLTQTGSSIQPFGFTGEPRDATGLTYLRARYYEPALGRFMTRDTWHGIRVVPGSLNDYSYLRDNPLIGVDRDGHCGPPCAIAGGAIGGVGGLAGYLIATTASGAPLDVGQAALAAGGGAATGAVCGVTLGVACVAVGAATSLAQYGLAPGPKSLAGAVKSTVLGGALAWFARGGIFNPKVPLPFAGSAVPNPIERFLWNYATNWHEVVENAAASTAKTLGGSLIQNGAPSAQVPLP